MASTNKTALVDEEGNISNDSESEATSYVESNHFEKGKRIMTVKERDE